MSFEKYVVCTECVGVRMDNGVQRHPNTQKKTTINAASCWVGDCCL